MMVTEEHGGSYARRPNYLRGDRTKARVYADSARLGFEETLRLTPDDPQRLVFLGLALAILGQKEKAIADGQRAVALAPGFARRLHGSVHPASAWADYIVAGEPDKALDQIEALLKMPYFLSPAWLRIDPNFTPLKGNPRFQRLSAGTP